MAKEKGVPKLNFSPADISAMGKLLEAFNKAGNGSGVAVYKAIISADTETIQGVFVGCGNTGASVEGIKNFARLMLDEFKE